MADISVSEAAKLLESAKSILVVSHKNPDEDTIGCALAIKEAYRDKEVVTVCDGELNRRTVSVFGERDFSVKNAEGKDFSLVIFVDTSTLALAGAPGETFKGKIDLKIDHHPAVEDYAANSLVDPSASACGEIIYEIIKEAGRLNKEAAYCIFAAMSSDNGCFRYSSTSAKSHRIAADLMDIGIDAWKINHLLFENISLKEVYAKRMAYGNIKFFLDGKFAFLLFTNEMKSRYSLKDSDLSDISGIPRDIEGVELSAVVKQKDDTPGEYRVSMRSGKKISSSEVCSLFGGGGHYSAAGANVKADSPEEAEKKILDAILGYLGDKNV